MLRGFGLGAVVLVAAAAAAALVHPAPVASAAAAAPHVVATSQGYAGISMGGGTVTFDGSHWPTGLTVTVALLQTGRSWPLLSAQAAEDGSFHATTPMPNGVQPGLPATFHTCYELAARKIDFCSDTVMQVPPVPRTS